ncbi:MAG: hypothetical protein WC807_16400 [Hyphomicrobium sp.]|jgi:transposase
MRPFQLPFRYPCSLNAEFICDDASRRFGNDAKGHKAFIAWIGRDVARVVFEPIDLYHRAFETSPGRRAASLVMCHSYL